MTTERSALDAAIDLGATFDWITPLLIWAWGWQVGGAVGFTLTEEASDHGHIAIKRRLAEVGISRTSPWMIVNGCYVFSVKQAQARHASYWLNRWGLGHGHGRLPKTTTTTARRKRREKRQKRRHQP